jgi:hypothetical protein
MDEKGLIDLLLKTTKYYKPARYVIGVLSVVILLKLINLFGLDSPKTIIGGVICFMFMLLFLAFSSVSENNKSIHPGFKNIAIVLGWTVVVAFILFLTSIFFDFPKTTRDILGFTSTKSENLNFIDEKASNWKTLINFQTLDGETCNYPMMFPDSIFNQEVKGDLAFVPISYMSDTTKIKILKAPSFIKGFWGYSVPFTIEGITKDATLTITNKFKVKVYANKKPYKHSNAESTCAGDGAIYDSKEIVILQTQKPYYEQLITFPQADFYTLKPNEIMGFEILFKIKDLGNYKVIVDVPYIYRGKKGVASFSLSDFIAPEKFDLWEYTFDTSDTTKYPLSKLTTNKWIDNDYKVTPSRTVQQQNIP